MIFAQDTIGIKINRNYMATAENRKWSIHLSPPFFAGNPLRYYLGKELSGKAQEIPSALFSFDISAEKFLSDHFAMGIRYQHSNATVTGAALIDKTTNKYILTDINASSDNVLLSGRYYYDIVIKSRWDRERFPKSAERVRRGYRKLVFFTGIGIGYGKVKYKNADEGKYEYPQLKNLDGFVIGVEVFGLQYYFNKHLGAFMDFGIFNTGVYPKTRAGIFFNP